MSRIANKQRVSDIHKKPAGFFALGVYLGRGSKLACYRQFWLFLLLPDMQACMRNLHGRQRGRMWHSFSTQSINVLGLQLAELTQLVRDGAGLPAFRAEQIFHEVHRLGNTRLDDMQALSRKVVAKLNNANMTAAGAEPVVEQRSTDGTRKWLLRLPPSKRSSTLDEIETALQRNLSTSDIVAQVMASQHALRSEAAESADSLQQLASVAHISPKAFLARPVSNVVFMGQGEPLYNWRAVKGAIHLLTHPQGHNMSRRRVTISTSGLAPIIPRIASETGASLAISLHSAVDAVRSRIMAVNEQWPLHILKEAIAEYISIQRSAGATQADGERRGSRDARVTLEYTLLAGVNDDGIAVRALTDFCKDLGPQWVHVNIIPFNPWDGAPYMSTNNKGIARFQRALQDSGVFATVRQPRGRDIMAACGQLQSLANHANKEAQPHREG